MTRSSYLLVGLALFGAAPLSAQRPLTISGVRGLTFGAVFPGVARVISRTDAANSGQFNFRGPNRRFVSLTVTLPSAMTGPGGAQLPLTFGANDAGYSVSQAIGSQVAFDPKQPFTARLANNGRGAVFLGGTARPAVNQRAGSYTGTIILTVTLL